MDDVIAVLETTDWEDDYDADWAWDRLLGITDVPLEAVGALRQVALDVDSPLEKRQFAIHVLSKSQITVDELQATLEVLKKDKSFYIRMDAWMARYAYKSARRERLEKERGYTSFRLSPSHRSKKKKPTG